MSLKLSGWDDTIVALSTPPGMGALGVIRLSGKAAIEIINSLFPSRDLEEQPSHSLHVGFLMDNGRILDEVVISIFKNGRSYTGENVAEISCHGSPFILQQVIDACIARGARLAKPGEFTQRAFLNGRLDLTQAEAVADLISSNTQASHKAALHNIRGGFSVALKELREQLVSFSALIELELDFSQEDVEFADRTKLNELVSNAILQTSKLMHSFKLGNVIRNGVSVAIIGKPNAGKSTLLNALLNEDRAIVSEIPGTTRDTIEEVINIDGILFRLIDTAGIRAHSEDRIETVGIEKSLKKMAEADLVIYLFDVRTEIPAELEIIINELKQKNINYIIAGNKTDINGEEEALETFRVINDLVLIAARADMNLDLLKAKMVKKVLDENTFSENVVVTNARHFNALKHVHDALKDIEQGLHDQIPGDLLSLDIRRCLQFLGEITGEITTEDQLDFIFSKFCIGK